MKTAVIHDFSSNDKQWIDSMVQDNFQYIPRTCPAHANVSCQDCIEILESKSTFTRFEETQLDKSLQFYPSDDPSQPGRWVIHGIYNIQEY